MAKREGKPGVDWDQLYASTDFRELFRYRKEKRTRTYQLRVLGNGNAELWSTQKVAVRRNLGS
jgi:hypothetical protein